MYVASLTQPNVVDEVPCVLESLQHGGQQVGDVALGEDRGRHPLLRLLLDAGGLRHLGHPLLLEVEVTGQ